MDGYLVEYGVEGLHFYSNQKEVDGTLKWENWVRLDLIKAYYDFEELPFDESFLSFRNRLYHDEGWNDAKVTEHLTFESIFGVETDYMSITLAEKYANYMRTFPRFRNVCDKKSEEHFVDLVKHIASQRIPEFLFGQVQPRLHHIRANEQ